MRVVEGKSGFVDDPEPSTEKSRPSSPDTLTRGSVVDVILPAGNDIFAGSAGWKVEAVCEGADGRDPLSATFPRCCLPLSCC
jgi:hypothetical protein